MKNIIVKILVGICLLFSVSRIHRYYYNSVPVASAGSCLRLTVEDIGTMEARVIRNNPDTDESLILIYKIRGAQEREIYLPIVTSYSYMRDLKAKEIVCP